MRKTDASSPRDAGARGEVLSRNTRFIRACGGRRNYSIYINEMDNKDEDSALDEAWRGVTKTP